MSVADATSLGLFSTWARPETEEELHDRFIRQYRATLERFMDKYVHEDADDPASCWIWIADTNEPKRYGRFKVLGRLAVAHRVAYELWVGLIPDGLTLDHLCRRMDCVNPFHLEPVTNAENVRRGRRLRKAKA